MIWILLGGFCAALYGFYYTHQAPSLTRGVIKTVATLCLLIAGITFNAPWVILIALAFGAVGDAFLARSREAGLLPGLIAFLLGHLIYVVWSQQALRATGDIAFGALQWGLVAVALASMMVLLVTIWEELGAMKGPVLCYCAVSFALVLVGIGFTAHGDHLMISAGIFAFVISDIILGVQLFKMRADSPWDKTASFALWSLYWLGQLGIMLGALSISGQS